METDRLITEFKLNLIIQRYSASTIKNYSSAVKSFLQFAEKKFNDPNELGVIDIEMYVLWKIERYEISSSHQHMIVASIEKFYNFVFGKDLNIKHLYPAQKQKSLPNYLTQSEVKSLIGTVENLKHKCIIMLLYGCGLRLSELLNLKIKDIDHTRMMIMIRNAKGYKDHIVMLSRILLDEIRMYAKQYIPKDFLFEGQSGRMYSPKSVQTIVKNYAQKVGINKHVTPQILRHSFAVHLLENGTDIRYIQNLLGHQSIKTTEIYTHLADISQVKIKSPLDFL